MENDVGRVGDIPALVADMRSIANCDGRAGEPLGRALRNGADAIVHLFEARGRSTVAQICENGDEARRRIRIAAQRFGRVRRKLRDDVGRAQANAQVAFDRHLEEAQHLALIFPAHAARTIGAEDRCAASITRRITDELTSGMSTSSSSYSLGA